MCNAMTALAAFSAGASSRSGQSNAKAIAKSQNTDRLSSYDKLNEKETRLNQASALDENEEYQSVLSKFQVRELNKAISWLHME